MAKYQDWLSEEKLILIEGWARSGLVEKQIAHNMGISDGTLRDWKKKYPPLSMALKKGKEVSDFEVENALYKSACGYNVDECTYERQFNKKTGDFEMVCVKKVTKHVPPSNTAQIFWLKNRKPEEWRDKRVVEDKVEMKSDGFLDALKGQAEETFKDNGGIVEE